MVKALQKLGKSVMLPMACLPIAALLMGIGYWIDPAGLGANSIAAAFLHKAGSSLIDNIPLLFAVGIAVGLSEDGDGTAALAGLVSWLMIQSLLSPAAIAMLLHMDAAAVNPAFDNIGNAFIGMLCGIIGALCYTRFKNTKLPDALSFFSGKRSVAIVSAGVTIIASLILAVIWPPVYNGLVRFGEVIISLDAVGAGIYAFLNRLLLPFGLHHALNSVFWFDIAGIDDVGKFSGQIAGGIYGQTGMYMTGFFPIMMFGLPAGALAMYHTAKSSRKKAAYGLLLSGALASFFTGITEPLEFSFMFLAPVLYVAHAALMGLSAAVCTLIPVRSGFAFSAGFIDWFLSFKSPMAQNPWLIVPIGLCFAVLYYGLFRFMILRFDLKTPGREEDGGDGIRLTADIDDDTAAATIIAGLGGKENIRFVDNCITRLRVEVARPERVNEKKIRSSGVTGIFRPKKTEVHIIIGTKVQFVTDEVKRLIGTENTTEDRSDVTHI